MAKCCCLVVMSSSPSQLLFFSYGVPRLNLLLLVVTYYKARLSQTAWKDRFECCAFTGNNDGVRISCSAQSSWSIVDGAGPVQQQQLCLADLPDQASPRTHARAKLMPRAKWEGPKPSLGNAIRLCKQFHYVALGIDTAGRTMASWVVAGVGPAVWTYRGISALLVR